MNQVIISGRLTRDPEVKYGASSQKAVARFCVAVDKGRDKSGQNRGANFLNCVAFDKTAETLERFSGKGLRVAVIGRLETGSYQNKEGQEVKTTDIIADRIEIIDFKDGSNQIKPTTQENIPEGFAAIAEQIPF